MDIEGAEFGILPKLIGKQLGGYVECFYLAF